MTQEALEPEVVNPNQVEAVFVAGQVGMWRIDRCDVVVGQGLSAASRLSILLNMNEVPAQIAWQLRGVTSYERYVNRGEHRELERVSPPLGRSTATCAALIPIRKSRGWWVLPADSRREIFEESSHHIATGIGYLPAIARRLYHSHDLGEPFDFLTWFEYAPGDAEAFEELVAELRATKEWTYVVREVDIRLSH